LLCTSKGRPKHALIPSLLGIKLTDNDLGLTTAITNLTVINQQFGDDQSLDNKPINQSLDD